MSKYYKGEIENLNNFSKFSEHNILEIASTQICRSVSMLSKQSHQCCSRRKHGQTIHPIEIFISINDHIGSKKKSAFKL